MFDDTTLETLYGDPVLAHNAVVAALACKALEKICKDSSDECESRRVACSAARKAERILQRSKMARF
ncbi:MULTISPECIES: hypothetical protein [Roseinatronobacter]|uniref:Uncharacterized protein n=1 Tax=Roseinatronobacter domitianus TaxID=2940293 RepID=A0ABT0LX83_9RHOB|nr:MULTISPECIES: hypothetical protein [Roseibaca]MCL1627230.1 hypothetical protein [Roseibaca domitiana]